MAERPSGYQQGNKERPILNRKNAGTGIEAAGVIVGAGELLSQSIVGAFVGGAIWLIGRWVKYAGTDSRKQ